MALATTGLVWLENLDEARQAARETRLPLFIDFWAYNCAGCEGLEAATYPDQEVARFLADHFVAARINSDERPDLAREFGVFWTPTLVTLHHLGQRLRETIGYLPPAEMLPELALTAALYDLRSARAGEAEARFQEVVDRFGASSAAPEALYWKGLAAYRRSKDKEDLWITWRELAAAYPESIWAQKTTLLV